MQTGLYLLFAFVVFISISSSEAVSTISSRHSNLNPKVHRPEHITPSRLGPDHTIMERRGGSTNIEQSAVNEVNLMKEENHSFRKVILRNALGCWGVVQVVSILANAIKRLYPIALQPFIQKDMDPYQWGLYVIWSLYMAYAEGYKAFQLKFSPMVVQRAFSIIENPNILNCLLAGPYSMGLFGASRKRMIVSWCITAGVFSLVKVVKMLPYPYRSIVDAGVVVGLSWGTLAIVILTIKALLGGKVEVPGEEDNSKVPTKTL